MGGRKEILEMYIEKTFKRCSFSLHCLWDDWFSGVYLYNLMNQVALKASADGLNSNTMSLLEYTTNKMMMDVKQL
jgi:hypothetical protein